MRRLRGIMTTVSLILVFSFVVMPMFSLGYAQTITGTQQGSQSSVQSYLITRPSGQASTVSQVNSPASSTPSQSSSNTNQTGNKTGAFGYRYSDLIDNGTQMLNTVNTLKRQVVDPLSQPASNGSKTQLRTAGALAGAFLCSMYGMNFVASSMCATAGSQVGELVSSFLDLFGGNSAPKIGIEYRGQNALEALKKQGFVFESDVNPDQVVAIAVPGKGYFTPEELIEYGWLRDSNGEWVPGPNARNLPNRGGANLVPLRWNWSNLKAVNGPSTFIVGQRTDVKFSIQAKLQQQYDGRWFDLGEDLVEETVTFLEYQPGCQFVRYITLTARIAGYTRSVRVPYYYNVAGFASTQGQHSNNECSQPNRLGQWEEIGFETFDGNDAYRSRLRLSDIPLISMYDEEAELEEEQTPEQKLSNMINNIGRPSPMLGGGLGAFSGGAPSTLGVRDALNRLESYAKNNIDNSEDMAAMQAYLREERAALQNSSPQERWIMVARMKSVDELIRSGAYQPGRLADALDEIKATGNYLPGDWVSLVFSPEMNGNNPQLLESKINYFLRNLP